MKYIIMCGGQYKKWETPRQLTKINGESIVERTIRLLKENGVDDIAISTNNKAFEGIAPILAHTNKYVANGYDNCEGHWNEAFYPTEEPALTLIVGGHKPAKSVETSFSVLFNLPSNLTFLSADFEYKDP